MGYIIIWNEKVHIYGISRVHIYGTPRVPNNYSWERERERESEVKLFWGLEIGLEGNKWG